MILKWAVCLSLAALASATTRCPSQKNCICTEAMTECYDMDAASYVQDTSSLRLIPHTPIKLNGELFQRVHRPALSTLVIDNATVTEIDETAFDGLDNLSQLVIKNSVLPELPSGLFKRLKNLKLMDLSGSKLTNFQTIESESVEQIKMSGCEIAKISTKAFAKCPRLEYLNLENNLIESFQEINTFNIDEINLANNRIRQLDLVNMSNVTVSLDLSGNPLEGIRDSGENPLEILNIHSCGFRNIDFLASFTSLVRLNMSNNEIEEVRDGLFYKMEELEIIDLSHNKIKKLSNNVFENNQRLSNIVLDGNDFESLPMFKSNINPFATNRFSCNDCKIKRLNGQTFKYMPSAQIISLRNNEFEELPSNLMSYVPGLVKLDLSNNKLSNLDIITFARNSELSTLILANNLFKSIPMEVFTKTGVLKSLDLSGCRLEKLWSKQSNMTISSLTALNLEHNKDLLLTADSLKGLNHLAFLELDPRCDTLYDVVKYVRKNDILPMKMNQERLPNKSWLDICDDEIDANYYDDAMNSVDTDMGDDIGELDDDDDDDDDFHSSLDGDINDENDDLVLKKEDKPEARKYPDDYVQDSDAASFEQDREDVMAVESVRFTTSRKNQEVIVFLLPTLVFVLTALIVLIITVAALLWALKFRYAAKYQSANIPHVQIKIPRWSTGNGPIMKKHSGSVYRPLSEEKIEVP